MKYAPDGTREWTRLLGTSKYDRAWSVTADSSGNLYAGGNTTEGLDGQTYSGGKSDIFVAKYDASGTKISTKLLGTAGRDTLISVTTGPSGELYLTGVTSKDLHGRAHNGGDFDGYVAKFSASGNRQWTRLIGAEKRDSIEGVDTDPSGNVYAIGWTQKGLYENDYAGGDSDVLVLKYTPSGSRRWARLLGTTGTDDGNSIAAGEKGLLHVAGSTSEGLHRKEYNGGDRDGFYVRIRQE